MIDVKEKNVYKSDKVVIERWVNDYFFIYKKKINLNKINLNKLKFLVLDNIRVGLKFRSFFFICPFAIFNKNYFDYKEVEKILKKKIKISSKNFYQSFSKKKILYSNLDLKLSKYKIQIKKILILGPEKRNINIIKKLSYDFIVINSILDHFRN